MQELTKFARTLLRRRNFGIDAGGVFDVFDLEQVSELRDVRERTPVDALGALTSE
jgi:hypothetical protein